MEATEVKTLLGIKTTKHDDYINAMTPLVVDYAKEYCHQDFIDGNGNESLPSGAKVFVAKAVEHNMNKSGLTGRSMGNVSYSYETDFPESIMKMLRAYRRLSW